jgi:hypothetical protein
MIPYSAIESFFISKSEPEDMEAIREAAQQGKAWGRAAFLEGDK